MKRVLVTGSEGFLGQNLRASLRTMPDIEVVSFDLGVGPDSIAEAVQGCDTVFHLAGANRPPSPEDFTTTNVGLTRQLVEALTQSGNRPLVLFSSSIQAEAKNPYGASKLQAEKVLKTAAAAGALNAVIFRLGNLFGKWSRPNYNSVVATFCHNVARGLPVEVHDPSRELELVYVDDVVDAMLLAAQESPTGCDMRSVPPCGRLSLGELKSLIESFKAIRTDLWLPDLSQSLVHRLYTTYLSYLPTAEFGYALNKREDPRGSLAEFVKMKHAGQIFVSRTHPGITRGNHHHRTKTEKFLVLEGQACVRFRHIITNDVVEVEVCGQDMRPVDIPPGYTHSITNTGTTELVTLFWASEPFDPDCPDTYFEEVGP